jgi:hypothetical protein
LIETLKRVAPDEIHEIVQVGLTLSLSTPVKKLLEEEIAPPSQPFPWKKVFVAGAAALATAAAVGALYYFRASPVVAPLQLAAPLRPLVDPATTFAALPCIPGANFDAPNMGVNPQMSCPSLTATPLHFRGDWVRYVTAKIRMDKLLEARRQH